MEAGFETLGEALTRLAEGKALTDHGRVAARAVEATGNRLKADGWRRLSWADRPRVDEPASGEWVDHPYVLQNSEGHAVYVSEHYGLTPRVLAQLCELVEQGWDVTVGADRSLYLPGSTVAIWVERASPSPSYSHFGAPMNEE